MKLPNEIIQIIYYYSDIDTKININKIMNWRFNVKNKFKNQDKIPCISPLLKQRQNKYFNYYDNMYSKLYYNPFMIRYINIYPIREYQMYSFLILPR